MYNTRKSVFVQVVAAIMVLIMILPMGAYAAVKEPIEPLASYYLSAYSAYVYLPGDGEVQVYFDVTGTGMMDDIGFLFIEIHESSDGENWDRVKVFNHYSTAGMLGHNNYYHCGHVSYDGVAGRYYKAYVCVWAGKNGDGDARYFWTSVKP